MNINLTLVVQMLVFALLVFGTMKFIWPHILNAMEERSRKIAQGLAAAEQGEQELAAGREVAGIAVRAASKLLAREIDARTHADLLDKLAAQI